MKSETFEGTKTHVDEEEASERYPTATLDVERITDVMAARLTSCLLGHVLYLKGQIPLYVDLQLYSKYYELILSL